MFGEISAFTLGKDMNHASREGHEASSPSFVLGNLVLPSGVLSKDEVIYSVLFVSTSTLQEKTYKQQNFVYGQYHIIGNA